MTNVPIVHIVKLISGEELLCEIDQNHPSTRTTILRNVFMIGMTNQGLGFIPFMPYSNAHEELTIDNEKIMFMVLPTKEVFEQFQKMTSKILTPNKTLIV